MIAGRGRDVLIADAFTLLRRLPERSLFGWQDVVAAFEREDSPSSRRHAYRWLDALEAQGFAERVEPNKWRLRFKVVRVEIA